MARIPIQQVPVDTTGPLSAANSAVTGLATGMGTAVFGVPVGIWTGTLVAEGTVLGDYSDAIALNVIPYGGGASQSSIVAGGIYEIGITGLTSVRLRAIGTISGGPITVLVRAAPGNKSIRVGAPAGNPVPVSDTATETSIGTQADPVVASGNGTVISQLKGILAKFTSGISVTGTFFQATQPVSSIDGSLATIGTTTDVATASGTNSSVIGALRSIRDKLLGSIAVTGTFYQATQPVSGTFFQAKQPVSLAQGDDATTGSQADTAATGTSITTGSFSVIALLKGIYNACAGATPAGANIVGKVGFDQTTPGTTNKVSIGTDGQVTAVQGAAGVSPWKIDGSGTTQPISATALPLPTGAATAANQSSQITAEQAIAGRVQGSIQYTETTSALAANASFVGMGRNSGSSAGSQSPYAYINVLVFADQAGTLFVKGSIDNSTFYPMNSVAGTSVAANSTVTIKVLAVQFYQIVYTNGGTANTKLLITSGFSGS